MAEGLGAGQGSGLGQLEGLGLGVGQEVVGHVHGALQPCVPHHAHQRWAQAVELWELAYI